MLSSCIPPIKSMITTVEAQPATGSPNTSLLIMIKSIAIIATIKLNTPAIEAITYVSGHSPYVVDYENELIDKYENWQKELEKREKAVEEREKALDERQDATEWTK